MKSTGEKGYNKIENECSFLGFQQIWLMWIDQDIVCGYDLSNTQDSLVIMSIINFADEVWIIFSDDRK